MTRRLHLELAARRGLVRRFGATLPLLAVGLLVGASCSSTSKSADSTTSNTTSASSGSSSAGTTSRPQREYPAGGPTDPVVPPGLPTYSLINSPGGCQELLHDTASWNEVGVPSAEGVDTTPLYVSAAYACLGRWNDAAREFAQIHANPDFRNSRCTRTVLLQWLTTLIRDRQQNSNFSPVFVRSSAPSPCPQDASSTTTVSEPTTTSSATSSVEQPPTTTTVLSTTTPSS